MERDFRKEQEGRLSVATLFKPANCRTFAKLVEILCRSKGEGASASESSSKVGYWICLKLVLSGGTGS
jgi:hypothetical protein